jgi:hypothetical protein
MSLSISKTNSSAETRPLGAIVSTRTNGQWELLAGCWRRHQMPQELSAACDPPLGSFSLPADGAIKLLSLKNPHKIARLLIHERKRLGRVATAGRRRRPFLLALPRRPYRVSCDDKMNSRLDRKHPPSIGVKWTTKQSPKGSV